MAFHGTSKTHLFNDPKIIFETESKAFLETFSFKNHTR